jgi:hypothetical protein
MEVLNSVCKPDSISYEKTSQGTQVRFWVCHSVMHRYFMCQVWLHVLIIPAPRRLRQEYQELKACLGYIMRPCV